MFKKILKIIKPTIFILESFFLASVLCTMIFTLIHNGSLFSIFHINDETKHLLIQEIADSGTTIDIYEIGEPVFFEESVILIKSSMMNSSMRISIDNNGKKLTNKNISVTWEDNIPSITIEGINQERITYTF